MKKYNTTEDELTEHIVNALERRSEQKALKELHSMDENELRAAIGRNREPQRISARPSGWRVIAVWSSVAAVIALVWVGFQPKYSAAELYQSYGPIAAYEVVPPSRGETEEDSAYEKTYEAALALIQSDKTIEAIEKLNYLAGRTSFRFHQNAKWELALAYLKIDKRTDAKRVLTEIADCGGEFSGKATELLQKIKDRRWF